jgi:acetyl esterase/lipase
LVSILGTSGDVAELEGKVGAHTDQSSRVQAVVNYFGPENFLTMVTQPSTVDRTTPDYPEALLIGGRVQDMPEAAKMASPVTYISQDDPPFLTAHGTKDPLVPFAQAEELHAGLKKAGASSVLITMKDAGHGFGSPELDNVVRRFLDKHLRGIEGEVQDATLSSSPPRRN